MGTTSRVVLTLSSSSSSSSPMFSSPLFSSSLFSFSRPPLLLSSHVPLCGNGCGLFSKRGIASTSRERLAKRMARSGVASRRAAEALIEQGKVFVNGVKATMKDNKIVDETDVVTVYGQKIRKSQPKLYMHYKKAGIIVTHKEDEAGRPSLFPRLKEIMGVDHIISVGRLDFNSEGLLLLTNDGMLARALELPENELERVYRVRFRGHIAPHILQQLERGVVVEGVKYKPMKVDVPEREGHPANKWITCTLSEGKNREIRRIFDHFEMPVSRIVRTDFGPYTLKGLAPGDTKQVPISWLQKHIDLKKLYPSTKFPKDKEGEHQNSPQQDKEEKLEKPEKQETKVISQNIGSVFGSKKNTVSKQSDSRPQSGTRDRKQSEGTRDKKTYTAKAKTFSKSTTRSKNYN